VSFSIDNRAIGQITLSIIIYL